MDDLYATEHLNFSSIYFALQNNISIQSTNQESVFLITVMYSGNTYIKEDNKYSGMDLLNHDVYLSFYPKGISYSSILPKDQKLQVFSFFFSKEQLIDYLIEFNAISLIDKINTIEKMEIIQHISLSIKSNYIIQKLIQNPYNGHLKNIYFESVVYELLISILTDLCPQKPKNILLSEGDKDILYKAKNILLSDLQNPPTIEELSKMVPMNQSKLKSGFKILFNNTIHKTLTEQRMEQAFENLKNLDMSVWEIAHEAGYENVSNFINVFRKKFGKTPGDMRRDKSFYIISK